MRFVFTCSGKCCTACFRRHKCHAKNGIPIKPFTSLRGHSEVKKPDFKPFSGPKLWGARCSTLPLNFASERVTGSFWQLYHYLVYKVCISALRQQLIAVNKQSVEKIPPFFCRQIKMVFLLPHTKITSALTVSVTAARRAFILCTHSIWLSAFSVSVMHPRSARCFISCSNSSCACSSTSADRIAAYRLLKSWYKAPFYAHGYTANAAAPYDDRLFFFFGW